MFLDTNVFSKTNSKIKNKNKRKTPHPAWCTLYVYAMWCIFCVRKKCAKMCKQNVFFFIEMIQNDLMSLR